MKKSYFLVVLALSTGVLFAKNEDSTPTQDAESSVTTLNDSLKKEGVPGNTALGIHFGFPGFGADFGYKFNEYFMGRFRFNYLNINLQDFPLNYQGQSLTMNFAMQFSNFDLMMDIHPFGSKFKIIAGVGYFNKGLIEGSGGFTETLTFGEIEFEPADIGVIGLSNEFPSIAPYLGFGFGRAVPKKGVGFGIEMGSYYMGKPNTEIIATGMMSDTKEQEEQLRENLSSFRWLPFMSLRLSFKF